MKAKLTKKVKIKTGSASTATMITLAWAIFGLILAQFIMHLTRGERDFEAHELYGETIVLKPAVEPNVTAKGMLRWSSLVASSIYTVNFLEYKEQVDNLRPFFTSKGYQEFRRTVMSTLIDGVLEKKLLVTSVVNAPAVIFDELYIDGKEAWWVQVPLLVTYQGASESNVSEQLLITMLIVRDVDSAQGVGVERLYTNKIFLD